MCDSHPEEPLVMTFHWRGREYVCLKCGRLYDFLSVTRKNATPARLARAQARGDEWIENAAPLITPASRLVSCERCAKGEDHDLHATDAERAAHEAAVEWLMVRTGRKKVAA